MLTARYSHKSNLCSVGELRFETPPGRVLYLEALARHLAELATQKMHESATKIAALTRGVLVRRTFFLSLFLLLPPSQRTHTHQKNRHKESPRSP